MMRALCEGCGEVHSVDVVGVACLRDYFDCPKCGDRIGRKFEASHTWICSVFGPEGLWPETGEAP